MFGDAGKTLIFLLLTGSVGGIVTLGKRSLALLFLKGVT
jgi:hypothetical protein